MSLTRLSTGLKFTAAAMAPYNTTPKYALFALKTPSFDSYAAFFQMRGTASDGYDGYHNLILQYGMYVVLEDRGRNYGAPLGVSVKADPGYNLSADGKVNKWTWFLIHIDSLSARGFRVGGSVDFTVGGTFNTPAAISRMEIGWGLPDSAKIAHVHWFSALSLTQYNAIVAGTLDPSTVETLIDGFTFKSGMSSVKGLLTATPYNATTPPQIDSSDDPVVGSSPGGVTPPAGDTLIRRSGGFGW